MLTGALCVIWIPYDCFLPLLAWSMGIAVILAALAIFNVKNEKRPPVAAALILEALWLPSRNGEITLGPLLWAFLGIAGLVTGLLLGALFWPLWM
ncbi:hypothetical protein SAMN05428948_3285 [Massilia sp. CF038]|nr:hypothetical protein SAMN05428948_3285 [Massilia sp. CF038]